MKYYIIAGEASGDLHGSNLMKALLNQDLNAKFRFWGGDLMAAVSGDLVVHYKERAFMGFTEIFSNFFKIFSLIKHCKKDILNYNPDAVIFIDNSGFNLPIAKWAKSKGYKTHYYISPQVWASRAKRVNTIKASIDHMYVVLPFVKDFYNKHNYKVHFVGHPLIDAISNQKPIDEYEFRASHELNDKPIIALLPGSRKQEVKKILSLMLSVIKNFPNYQFVIAGAPSLDYSFYKLITGNNDVKFINNKTYDLLNVSSAALVTSGTATLETALFKIPQIVCYKGGWLSYQIAKRLIKHIRFISLVNLIMDKQIVTELIQNELNYKRLNKELELILDPYERAKFFINYYDLEKKLGGKGASKKVAKLIFSNLQVPN